VTKNETLLVAYISDYSSRLVVFRSV